MNSLYRQGRPEFMIFLSQLPSNRLCLLLFDSSPGFPVWCLHMTQSFQARGISSARLTPTCLATHTKYFHAMNQGRTMGQQPSTCGVLTAIAKLPSYCPIPTSTKKEKPQRPPLKWCANENAWVATVRTITGLGFPTCHKEVGVSLNTLSCLRQPLV